MVIFTNCNIPHNNTYIHCTTFVYNDSNLYVVTVALQYSHHSKVTFTSSSNEYKNNENIQYVWPAGIDFGWLYAEIGQKMADEQLLLLTL